MRGAKAITYDLAGVASLFEQFAFCGFEWSFALVDEASGDFDADAAEGGAELLLEENGGGAIGAAEDSDDANGVDAGGGAGGADGGFPGAGAVGGVGVVGPLVGWLCLEGMGMW